MAEFASAPLLVELYIFKMTKVAAGFAHFEFLLIGFVLVARCASDHLTFDLFLFIQMQFVNKTDFLGKLDFFGFEFIVRFTVTGSGHAASIGNMWSCADGIAAQLQIGKMPRWFGRDVTGFGYANCFIDWGFAR